MEPEEREVYEIEQARCRAEAEQLLRLVGDPLARDLLDAAWAPLLRRPGYMSPPCVLPYDAPELIP